MLILDRATKVRLTVVSKPLNPSADLDVIGACVEGLWSALDHFGVTYGPRWSRFVSWSEIPTTSLVKVSCGAGGRTWFHWVIFQRRDDGRWGVGGPKRFGQRRGAQDGKLRKTS